MDKEIKSIFYCAKSERVGVYICMRVEGRLNELVRSTENKLSVIKLYMPTIHVSI